MPRGVGAVVQMLMRGVSRLLLRELGRRKVSSKDVEDVRMGEVEGAALAFGEQAVALFHAAGGAEEAKDWDLEDRLDGSIIGVLEVRELFAAAVVKL